MYSHFPSGFLHSLFFYAEFSLFISHLYNCFNFSKLGHPFLCQTNSCIKSASSYFTSFQSRFSPLHTTLILKIKNPNYLYRFLAKEIKIRIKYLILKVASPWSTSKTTSHLTQIKTVTLHTLLKRSWLLPT